MYSLWLIESVFSVFADLSPFADIDSIPVPFDCVHFFVMPISRVVTISNKPDRFFSL